MLTLIILTLVAIVAVYRLAPRHYPWAWLGSLLGLLFLCLFGLESLFSGTGMFISDENYYMEEGRALSLFKVSDRYLWILLNSVILRYDWSVFGLPLKLVNLPLVAVLMTLLWRIFDRDRLVWWLPVLLPYVVYTATFNLRDTAIFAATATCVFFLDNRSKFRRLLFFPAVGVLYLLRPPIALASMLIWLTVLAGSGLRRVLRGRIPAGAVGIVGGGLVIVTIVFGPPVFDRVQRYYAWYQYVMGEGYAERVLGRGLETEFLSGSWPQRLTLGAARYSLAPLPTSLFTRILAGGSAQWGMVDDIVRFIHQSFYYAITAFVFLRWRYWVRTVKALTRGQLMLLLAFSLYLPVYSLYHFGLGHQRVKIPFQIAMFLFAIVIHRTQERYAQPKHCDGLEDDRTRI